MTDEKRAKIRAGTFTEDGQLYAVIVEYREQPAQALRNPNGQTVEHGAVPPDAIEIAIMGETWHADAAGNIDRRCSDMVSGGQNVEDARKAGAVRLAELWDRWHLNGMRAACVHQREQQEQIIRDYRRYHDVTSVLLDHVRPCPETGYKYGTAWLFESVPDDVLAELRAIFGVSR